MSQSVPPLPPGPYSLSVAPPPRMTETSLLSIAAALEDRAFPSLEDANAWLRSPEAARVLAGISPKAPHLAAQALALKAWEMDPPDRYTWARRALAMEPRTADAWLLLAEEEHSWRKQRRAFERAYALAGDLLTDLGLLEEDPNPEASLYSQVAARPFFRAAVALARCLTEGGYQEEAVPLYESVLAHDPDDHMGVRYELVPVFHQDDEPSRLQTLLERFPDASDALLAYERLWLALVLGDPDAAFEAARAANPHVPEAFRNLDDTLADAAAALVIGGPEEARFYVRWALPWWVRHPAAVRWLLDRA